MGARVSKNSDQRKTTRPRSRSGETASKILGDNLISFKAQLEEIAATGIRMMRSWVNLIVIPLRISGQLCFY